MTSLESNPPGGGGGGISGLSLFGRFDTAYEEKKSVPMARIAGRKNGKKQQKRESTATSLKSVKKKTSPA